MRRLLLLTVLALVAPASASPPKLDWKACETGFECATAEVPLARTVARSSSRSRAPAPSTRPPGSGRCSCIRAVPAARVSTSSRTPRHRRSPPFTRPETLDVGALVDHTTRYLRRCIKVNGDAIGHMSSADVARDLDVLRATVGDKRLNYIGHSQGTLVGATYTSLFPGRSAGSTATTSASPRCRSRARASGRPSKRRSRPPSTATAARCAP